MPTYRIYTLSEEDRIHAPAHPVECPDDAAAIQAACQWLDGHVMEVWDGNRLVGRLKPDQKQSSI
jgi:hypothetical protein